MIQRALALSQALKTGAAGFYPVRGQRHGQLTLLTGAVVTVVEMPHGRMSLRKKHKEKREAEREEKRRRRMERMVGLNHDNKLGKVNKQQ